MKAYERHAAGVGAGYKLSAWDERSCTFREVKGTHPTAEAARAAARKPGRFRVSRVDDGRWEDAGEFTV